MLSEDAKKQAFDLAKFNPHLGFGDSYWWSKIYYHKTAVFYPRQSNGEYTGTTIVAIVDDDGSLALGISYCNLELDAFCRRLGRHIATSRAMKMLSTMKEMEGGLMPLMIPNTSGIGVTQANQTFFRYEQDSILTRLVSDRYIGVHVPADKISLFLTCSDIYLPELDVTVLEKIFN